VSHTDSPSATQEAGGAMVPPLARTPRYGLPVPKSEGSEAQIGPKDIKGAITSNLNPHIPIFPAKFLTGRSPK